MSTIRVTTGCEGPSQDPCGYTELLVTRPDGRKVVFHSGRHASRSVLRDDVEMLRQCPREVCYPTITTRVRSPLIAGLHVRRRSVQ